MKSQRNPKAYSLSLQAVGMISLTPSTLLIPECYLDFFQMRKQQFGSINAYFLYLFAKYVRNLRQYGITPQRTTQKWKTQYQANGLDLKKRNFIPDAQVWESNREIARAFGVSICLLFVIVMKLDLREWEAEGRPDTVPELVIPQKQRTSYPCFKEGGPEMLKNFSERSFLLHQIDFSTEILHRAKNFRQ